MRRRLIKATPVAFLALGALLSGCTPSAPYPPSEIVEAIEWRFDERIELAPGSDNWAMTWAGRDTHFAAWGDGGGFGGSNSDGRVGLGVARIEGSHPHFEASNVWGGLDGEAKPTFSGKSYGILSLDDQLWMWVSPGSGVANFRETRLYVSDDEARSWTQVDWAFTQDDRLALPAFLQFGPDAGAAAGDEFVYVYFVELQGEPKKLRVHRPGRIHLARASRTAMAERGAWQFYAGFESAETPRWQSDPAESRPVFEDQAGVGWTVSVSHHAGLDRYVLTTEHRKSFRGNFGIFEAPNPWGPWSTIEYLSKWGPDGLSRKWFYGNIAPGWSHGDEFVFVASGIGESDRWMSVPARFVRRSMATE